MEYESYNKLKGKTLEYGDKVIFKTKENILECRVCSSFLLSTHYNGKIFTELGLNKEKFCEQHYGYSTCGGDFPESKYKDFEALTRVTLALLKLCQPSWKERLEK